MSWKILPLIAFYSSLTTFSGGTDWADEKWNIETNTPSASSSFADSSAWSVPSEPTINNGPVFHSILESIALD
jgi:hypothetical protein